MINIKNSKFIQNSLNSFKDSDIKKYLLKTYCDITIQKYFQEDISLLNLKRRISVAKDYLHYCNNFKLNIPNQNSLEGYLWLFYNKKCYLKDFLESISSIYPHTIEIKKIKKTILQRPKKSHQILRERAINILQNPYDKHISFKYAFDVMIGYFHWVLIPSNVFIKIENIKQKKKENSLKYFFTTSNFEFYLSTYIIKVLNIIYKNTK